MGMLAKVEGELFIKEGSGRLIEPFEEEFVLSDEIQTIPEARAFIKKALIVERIKLKKKGEVYMYPGFRGIRTLQVISLTPSAVTSDASPEVEKLFLEAIELNCVPDNIGSYKRQDYKINALKKAIVTQKERIEKEKLKKQDNFKN